MMKKLNTLMCPADGVGPTHPHRVPCVGPGLIRQDISFPVGGMPFDAHIFFAYSLACASLGVLPAGN